jgi:hypothetical protein
MVDPQTWHGYVVVPLVMVDLFAAATVFDGGTIAVEGYFGHVTVKGEVGRGRLAVIAGGPATSLVGLATSEDRGGPQ